jgi:pyruvate,water dikinase
MDLEWGKDGETGELFILQARPETVHSQQQGTLLHFEVTAPAEALCEGLAVGSRVATGTARVVNDTSKLHEVQPGDILVARNTNPDWEPVMKIASALVTEEGGRTSHAAIVAREHGIPAVVAAQDARVLLAQAGTVTVSCAEGPVGRVYSGAVPFETVEIDFASLPNPKTHILVNLADPDQALGVSRLPVDGVGLVRMEFLFAGAIGIHPLALLHPEQLDPDVAAQVAELTAAWPSPQAFFVERLSAGIARIAAAFHPRPVIVRFSDFKSNEYAHLLGGEAFEPSEENPMIGWRGASRYAHPVFKDAFALEVAAMKRVRDTLGFDNTHVMVPFCRTPEEGQSVLDELTTGGLPQAGGDGVPLKVNVMAEIPSKVLLAAEFAALFDGFAIGSHDLTQLVYGVDRDSAIVAHLVDDDGPALQEACRLLLKAAQAADTPVGICGQAPSDHPEFAAFLVRHGINSISVTPDAVLSVTDSVARAEKEL